MKEEFIPIKDVNSNTLIEDFIKVFQPEFKFINYNASTHIFIFEYYYLRITSFLTTTIIFDIKNQKECNVHVIISGGATGVSGITWGSEKSMMKKNKKFLFKLHCFK